VSVQPPTAKQYRKLSEAIAQLPPEQARQVTETLAQMLEYVGQQVADQAVGQVTTIYREEFMRGTTEFTAKSARIEADIARLNGGAALNEAEQAVRAAWRQISEEADGRQG
jgi:hypothetical protein